jgi:pyridoxamine 5'-phosphate oxidase
VINPPEMFGGDVDVDASVQDPLGLLDRWLASVGGGVDAPAGTDFLSTPLMALATVDAEGYPRVRHVLLSAYDHGRLHFHTDQRSAKAAQLEANPRAGATIVWPENARQLSVSGNVVRESPEESARVYTRRSRYLQVLAWVNDPGLTELGEAERRRRWADFAAAHPKLDPPPTWAGFVLVPEIITFWRGAPEGPSQRLACRRTHDGWVTERLPG